MRWSLHGKKDFEGAPLSHYPPVHLIAFPSDQYQWRHWTWHPGALCEDDILVQGADREPSQLGKDAVLE